MANNRILILWPLWVDYLATEISRESSFLNWVGPETEDLLSWYRPCVSVCVFFCVHDSKWICVAYEAVSKQLCTFQFICNDDTRALFFAFLWAILSCPKPMALCTVTILCTPTGASLSQKYLAGLYNKQGGKKSFPNFNYFLSLQSSPFR